MSNTSTTTAVNTPSSGKSSSSTLSNPMYDLICVGFGPASLAIAVALLESEIQPAPRVLFIEKQAQFAWHSGMLLPGARMQISFIKDMASLRNPRSHFTFLNYLHQHGRLVDFTNLDTFLPRREEYNDYLTWCARHFDDQVRYGEEVQAVEPLGEKSLDGFRVISRNGTGETETRTARNVIVAVGGKPNIPAIFPKSERIVHSSQYSYLINKVLPNSEAPYKIAVVGAGQSAAEIFADTHSRYPNSNTAIIFKNNALKPSDDSPFVNEIFNPEKVDEIFSMPPSIRHATLTGNKATNYGVVRLELLERLFEQQYMQKLRNADASTWPHRILPFTEIVSVKSQGQGFLMKLRHVISGAEVENYYDAIVVATGYIRDAHKTILRGVEGLVAKKETGETDWTVDRQYRLRITGKEAKHSGIWLQGCNEMTHGLSDTLLSILSIRAGEVVESVFGKSKPSPIAVKVAPPAPAPAPAPAAKAAPEPLKKSTSRKASKSGADKKNGSCIIC